MSCRHAGQNRLESSWRPSAASTPPLMAAAALCSIHNEVRLGRRPARLQRLAADERHIQLGLPRLSTDEGRVQGSEAWWAGRPPGTRGSGRRRGGGGGGCRHLRPGLS